MEIKESSAHSKAILILFNKTIIKNETSSSINFPFTINSSVQYVFKIPISKLAPTYSVASSLSKNMSIPKSGSTKW